MTFTIGPFAEHRLAAYAFGQNLYIAHAVDEYSNKIAQIQSEYEDALLKDDQELQERKMLEMQSYQASLQLTALILDEEDTFA